jgi:hypothetical protein
MNKKIIAFIMLTFVSVIKVNAQLLATKTEVIENLGPYDFVGVPDDSGYDTNYFAYSKNITRDKTVSFKQMKMIYFKEINSLEICYMWVIIEPVSQTNFNVKNFKSKFVEIDKMKWKDYEHNTVYSIDISKGVCGITAYYDFE